MKKISLEIDGKAVEGYAVQAGATLWAHLDGETFTIETKKKSRRASGGAAVNPGVVLAPMPGKIIKIMVKAGETVGPQQILLVMEAMKMEYTLKAQAGGSVQEICCGPGQQVTLGQVLARLEVSL